MGVLNACRGLWLWSGQSECLVPSKEETGGWAFPRLPESHRAVVRDALAAYRGPRPVDASDRQTDGRVWNESQLRAFREYIVTQRTDTPSPAQIETAMNQSDVAVTVTGMNPILAVRDLALELPYYTDRLGFVLSWRWGEPTVRVGVGRDGWELQLVSDGRGAPSGPSVVYFLVRGVDAYYARCVERGVEIELPVDDRPFGMRDFRIRDLSGNVLGFGEPLPAPAM